jgi:tetratricopeptide (TPR) repeat protein
MRRELTYGRETSAFEGTREFVFKHHVLHQVTYQSVLKRPRREQHRLTADWLVVRSGDRASEYFGLIADHYEKAGDTANAVVYLHKAGADAARSYVNQAALDYLGRALALTPLDDVATRFELLRTRHGVFSNTGRRAEQEADISALEQLAEQLDDDAQRARAASLRSSHALVTADYAGAAAAAARAVSWAESSGARAAALFARINWARALQFKGDYSSALDEHIEQALALAREVGDKRVECVSLMQLGILAFQRGRYGEARGYYQQALALSRAIGDRLSESNVINNLGDTERLLGNYAAAFELFQAGRRLCSEIGQRMVDAYLLCNMAHIAFLRGDPAESLRWSKQSSEVAADLNDPDLRATLLSTRGHAHTELGAWAEAETCYQEAAAIFREIGRTTMPPEPVAGLARLALARGDVARATSIIAEVIAHFDGNGSVDGTEDPLWIHLTCHQVLAAAGSPRAGDFLECAWRLLRERAAPLDAAERATFLGNVPSHRAIVAAWAQSRPAPSPD